MLGFSAMPAYQLEFYEDAAGDCPVRRWLAEELTRTQRFALGQAMREQLQAKGVRVCATAFGKQLGKGLFEFRLRRDTSALGLPGSLPAGSSRILLRVFCHAYGDRIVLLLGGYDKGADPSPRRQGKEIAIARDRLSDWRRRHGGPGGLDPDVIGHILALDEGYPAEAPHEQQVRRLHEGVAGGGPAAGARRPSLSTPRSEPSTDSRWRSSNFGRRAGSRSASSGRRAGIQQAEISRIEAGNSNPTLSTIAALAQALGAELSLSPARSSRSKTRSTAAGKRLAPSRAAARRVARK